jgi:murein DD-endopeptidase MepM/ murein hydrolase activator NlpD
MHNGIDIAEVVGTPVLASASGTVTYAGWNDGGYGNLIEVTHSDGSLIIYGHNDRILVYKGQRVEQSQQIAEMGSTGKSTGPHLHFEIIFPESGAVDPLIFLPKISESRISPSVPR